MVDVQKNNSYFDGSLLGLILHKVLAFALTVATLGLAYPWALCMLYNWEVSHQVVNGKRLKFTGTGSQLFGNWIKWAFLTIITFGIYSFWLNIKLKQWICLHTEFAD